MGLEWCSHCCMFSEIRLSVLEQKPCNIISSSCTQCGKILSDTSMPMLPLKMRIPDKRKKKTRRRMKRPVRQPKHYVKAETSDLSSDDSNSVLVDPTSKEEKQPIYSDSESSNF